MDDLQEVLRMGNADTPSSYAANSNLQGDVIANAKPLMKEVVEEICSAMLPGAQQLVVADLGCSYGPNAFSTISEVMNTVAESYRKQSCGPLPDVQFFLNDLPANDFNYVFRSLASYKKKFMEDKGEELAGRFYVAGVAGSFYGRLFPSRSIHLFHSSSSVHWLSKVPEGLKDEHSNELNKGNIYIGRTSPPCVQKAYLQQFWKDFSTFLRCRSQEIQDGGLMVLTLLMRTSSVTHTDACILMSERISEILKSMADEGVVKEADIDTFNLPFYNPSVEELQVIINDQGAFQIVKGSVMALSGDVSIDHEAACKLQSKHMTAQNVAGMMRSIMDTLLASHFRDENVVDQIFTRLANILTREWEKGEQFNFPFYAMTLKKNNAP